MPNSFCATGCLLVGFAFFVSAPARAAEIENVVLIVSDDLKASVLGCYGDTLCQTPNLDRLASDGTVFRRAYCQGTSCRPSRISFMFSRYRDEQGQTLGEHLQVNGRTTCRIGKIFHMRVPGDIIAGTDGDDRPECWTERYNSTGLEAHTLGAYACLNLNIFTRELANRESTKMRHRMFVSVQQDGDGSDQPDYKSASKAAEFIQRDHQRPFFLAVGLVRPHYPMVAPPEYFQPYEIEKIQMPANWSDDLRDIPKLGLAGTRNDNNPIGKYPDNQKRMWSAYYASVSFMDHQVGRIMDALRDSPYRDNTAVIFTSDHGYHLGEHGFWQKSNLHEEVLRVPLIVQVPGMKSPVRRSDAIVELVDLYPTICRLLRISVPASVQGSSLVPALTQPDAEIKREALSFNKGTSLRCDGWHYMRYNDGTEELYDMKADPGETNNLAKEAAHASMVDSLRRRLDERLNHLSGLKIQR